MSDNGKRHIGRRTSVVFDLGGVLIDWDPRHLYRTLFLQDEAAMEQFLAEVCTSAWNLQQDAGRTWAEGTALLKAEHATQAAMIDAFHLRWSEMIAGPMSDTVAVLRELKAARTPLYALTNWSYETFPLALEKFDFMHWFQGIVVSGQEKLVKPDPRIYRLLMERHGLQAEDIVFIDDKLNNVSIAIALGMRGIHFTDAAALRHELASLGLMPRTA